MTVYWVLAYAAPWTDSPGFVLTRQSFTDERQRDAVANEFRARPDVSPVIVWRTRDNLPPVPEVASSIVGD